MIAAYFESRGISRPMCQNSLRSGRLAPFAVSTLNGVRPRVPPGPATYCSFASCGSAKNAWKTE